MGSNMRKALLNQFKRGENTIKEQELVLLKLPFTKLMSKNKILLKKSRGFRTLFLRKLKLVCANSQQCLISISYLNRTMTPAGLISFTKELSLTISINGIICHTKEIGDAKIILN